MKLKIIANLLFAFLVVYLFSSFKPQNSGQVYFIRVNNMVGSMIAYKVYIDDTLVCHLKNKHYSVHTVALGQHTVSIQNTGLGSHKKSKPLQITVVAGKSNYLSAINNSQPYLEEVVENSAKQLLNKAVSTNQCLTAKDNKN